MFGEIDSVETRHSKSKLGLCPLPITFWTDLGYKELPSVILTKGSIFTENNYSINWNLFFSFKSVNTNRYYFRNFFNRFVTTIFQPFTNDCIDTIKIIHHHILSII